MTITCFLPCRKGSERVPKKNIRPIAGREFGLLEIKLQQLLACRRIDQVLLSTNDPDIIRYAQTVGDQKLVILERDDALASSDTSTKMLMDSHQPLFPPGG